MSREFKLIQDYYDEDVKLYKKSKISIEPGLTVLIGCNGAGKTTLLRQIKDNLKSQDIPYLYYDNLRDGGSNARSAAGYYGDFKFLATSWCSSEGENIVLNIGKFAQKIGDFMRKNTDKKEVWILLDAIDSGLSVDAVVDLKEGLFNTIFDNFDNDVYIVCVANEYELARGEQCFDVINGKYVQVKSYDRYRNLILKSREIKDERYE
jgi:energy-coupling factor transporter ATP-binding protein EcfA2